jgi:hypothetical protein
VIDSPEGWEIVDALVLIFRGFESIVCRSTPRRWLDLLRRAIFPSAVPVPFGLHMFHALARRGGHHKRAHSR